MRQGQVFRRCTRCGKRVKERRCECGNDRATWCFVVDLEPPGMPRRQVKRGGFATKAAAQEAMSRLQHERADGRYVEPTRLTVGVYLDMWMEGLTVREEVRANTRDEWSSHVRTHLKPRLGAIRLQQLSLPLIRACYGELRQSGRVRTQGGLSPKSVWNIHRCLHRALADAVKDGLIRVNPASGAMTLPRDRPALQFWTSVELTEFLGWLDRSSSPHEQALYRLAAQTGMRRGELLGLRWLDLDFDRRQVTIVQQLARRQEFGAPKTRASRRTMDLSAEVVQALQAHRDAQDAVRRDWAEAYEDHGLVFARENGTPHDPRVVTHRFAVQTKAASVKRIRFHDLRHTSAVIGLRELGEWPDEVSKRLGHTSVAFTLDTYGHLLPQRGRQVADAFGRLLRPRTDDD